MGRSVDNNVFELLKTGEMLPDFSMSLFDKGDTDNVKHRMYSDSEGRLKSVGNIQTIFTIDISVVGSQSESYLIRVIDLWEKESVKIGVSMVILLIISTMMLTNISRRKTR